MRPDPIRRGSILVIVAGLSAMLLMLVMVFLSRMRSDGQVIESVVRETRARLMLPAACQFIQESSRLGWGDESYGWTDLRDGSIGPRGPRGRDGKLPIPTWWRPAYGTYPATAADPLPDLAKRRWPCPGAALRGEMATWERPPAAIRIAYATNPVLIPKVATEYHPEFNNNNWWRDSATGGGVFGLIDAGASGLIPSARANALSAGVGSLDPQPVSDTLVAFQRGSRRGDVDDGDPVYLPGSQGLSWFRVYREMPEDHDNDQKTLLGSKSVPCWHDTVPLPNHWSVFIITCGAGPTRGYRFWNRDDPDWSAELEEQTAEESGLFPDKTTFLEMRQRERLLWYRVEWTANQGGSFSASETYGVGGNLDQVYRGNPSQAARSFAGAMQWIQRLDREPPRW